MSSIEDLNGLVLESIDGAEGSEALIFTTTCGRRFKMHHEHACCEYVYLEDVCGDLIDLIGHPILVAHENTNLKKHTENEADRKYQTWSFYELATIKGSVTLRWLGESNGCYSEEVDFEEI